MADKKHHQQDAGGDNGPSINKAKLAQNYGFALAFMNSSPELKQLFNQAVKGTWSTSRFIAALRNTDWFKHHSVSVRNAILQETADPETYRDKVAQMESQVRDQWGQMFGNTADPGNIKQWAETAYRMGWSQSQLIDHMTHAIGFQKLLKQQALGGQAAALKQQIYSTAEAYGLNVGDHFVGSQIERVLRGNDTIDGVTSRLQDWAQREYKAFAPEIQGGATVQDIAQPYISKMADLLEVNPQSIGLHSHLIQAALHQETKDGKPAAMSLTDFANVVRRDPRWQYTDNAHQQMASVTANLLQDWGVLA